MPDDTTTPIAPDGQKQATSLIALEGLINNYLHKIESHQEELNNLREMVNSALENNEDYVTAAKEAKDAAAEKAGAKSLVLQQPEIAKINDNLKEAITQMKEMKASLSQYLTDYASQSGSNQFEDDQGQVREIIYVAKIVKRSNKFRN